GRPSLADGLKFGDLKNRHGRALSLRKRAPGRPIPYQSRGSGRLAQPHSEASRPGALLVLAALVSGEELEPTRPPVLRPGRSRRRRDLPPLMSPTSLPTRPP